MDIVSDLPFCLEVIRRFPTYTVQKAKQFCLSEHEACQQQIVTLSVEENDEIELLFDAADPQAKFYFETFDIIPLKENVTKEDTAGKRYRIPSPETFFVYREKEGYNALCVGMFRLAVFCNGNWYYGMFEVRPKQMSTEEWQMMKDELEQEFSGLAQDLLNHHSGVMSQKLPAKVLHDFTVICKYAKNVMAALVDIGEHPRYEIQTRYKMVSDCQPHTFDAKTAKQYVMRYGSGAAFQVPQKVVCYDILDNRLLKHIVKDYESRLETFLTYLSEIPDEEERTNFFVTAQKLKKMTSILKTKSWYFQISDLTKPYIPHSFILDTRYNVLYQMYQELRDEKVADATQKTNTWKQSSYLYEMWCYLHLCRILAQEMQMYLNGSLICEKQQRMVLESGATVLFENERLQIRAVYDAQLPTSSAQTSMEQPLYMAKPHETTQIHARPDIVLYVYQKQQNRYLGSLILECKYRKLNSFWFGAMQRSSLGQLEAYYNNARSDYLYGTWGKRLSIRPVRKVIVLTPDLRGDGMENADYGIRVKSLKPSDTDELDRSLKTELFANIAEMERLCEELGECP